MLLGQVKYSSRLPFRRPAQAGFYKPTLPPTAMYSHINPLMNTTLPMPAFRANLPNLPRAIRPGTYQSNAMQTPFPTRPGPAPAVPQMAPQMRGSGFGQPQGGSPFNFLDTDVSRRMRTGAMMHVPSTSAGIRAGVTQAPQLMRRLMPQTYPGAFRPAGGY